MLPGRVRNPRPSVRALDQRFGSGAFRLGLLGRPTPAFARKAHWGFSARRSDPRSTRRVDVDLKGTDADISISSLSGPWVRETQELLGNADSSDRQTGSDERARIHEHPTVS